MTYVMSFVMMLSMVMIPGGVVKAGVADNAELRIHGNPARMTEDGKIEWLVGEDVVGRIEVYCGVPDAVDQGQTNYTKFINYQSVVVDNIAGDETSGKQNQYYISIPAEAREIELRMYPKEGYEYRAQLFANYTGEKANIDGQEINNAARENTGTENEYLSYKVNADDLDTLERLVFQVGFEQQGGGGMPIDNEIKNNVAIKVGGQVTKLLADDEPNEAYLLTETEENGKRQLSFGEGNRAFKGIGIIKDNDNYNVIIDGFNYPDAELVISGFRMSVSSAGTNTLKSIVLCDGMNIEIRPGNSLPREEAAAAQSWLEDKPVTSINLNVGIYTQNGTAQRLGLRDDVSLVIGKQGEAVTDAFKDIEILELYNYDFHKRGKYSNNIINAENVFTNVKTVELYYSVLEVNAANLFAGELETREGNVNVKSKGTLEVFQQAQFKYNRSIALQDGSKVIDRYYHHYPDNSKPFTGRTKNAGIIAYDQKDDNGQLYIQTLDITENINKNEAVTDNDHHYKLAAEGDNNIITSTDPIIYSVMYNVDDDGDGRKVLNNGKNLENGNCGQVEMKNFEKGYYILDGSHGKFEAWVAAGEKVDVYIMPDAGYQYVGDTLNINAQPVDKVAPDDDTVGKYNFTMTENAGHISAGFARTEDIVDVDEALGLGASLKVGDKSIKNGNAKLEVNCFTGDQTEMSNLISNVVGDNNSKQFIDITLSEYVVKNYDSEKTVQDAWETKQTKIEDPVTVTIDMLNDISLNAEYEIVRVHYEDEGSEPEITKLETIYDSAKNTVSFSTDKFSTYILVKKGTPQFDDAANKVAVLISETLLPIDAKKMTEADELKVKEARKAYDALTDEQKAKVDKDCVDKLLELEKAISEKKPVEPVPGTTDTKADEKKDNETASKPSEVGAEIKDTSGNASGSTSTYEVTDKSTGAGDKGEVTYKGEAAGTNAVTVVIPDTIKGADGVTYEVTKIEDNALKGNTTVKSVTIGNNIVTIGKNAFQNAKQLTTVKIGDNVKSIDSNAFAGCSKIKKITVGSKLISIGQAAFSGNKALQSIDMSKSGIKSIGSNAFKDAGKLKTIKLNVNTLKTVGKNALNGVNKKATVTLYAKNKKTYNKAVKLFKKSGAKKLKYKFKKKK